MISLLERFYNPSSKQVLIDGADLKNMQVKLICEKIGLVIQELVLFATLTKKNSSYRKENTTKEHIKIAIELTNVARFIYKLSELKIRVLNIMLCCYIFI